MRTITRMLCGGLLGAGLSLLLLQPSTSHAQYGGATGGGGKNTALAEARKKITELQAELNELKVEQKRLRAAKRAEFEEKDEWKNTLANHKKTKAAYEQAKKKAMAETKAMAEYKELAKEKDALKVKLDEMGTKRSTSPDEITTVSTELTEKATAMKKMEEAALKEDERILEAKDAYDAAVKELAALDEEVEDALYADPDYEALRKKIEELETQITSAREQLAQERKSQAQRPSKGGSGMGPGGGSGMGKGAMKGKGKRGGR